MVIYKIFGWIVLNATAYALIELMKKQKMHMIHLMEFNGQEVEVI